MLNFVEIITLRASLVVILLLVASFSYHLLPYLPLMIFLISSLTSPVGIML